MTIKQLRLSVLSVIGYLVALIAIAAFEFSRSRDNDVYIFIKESSPLLISLPAAYLTYCLQRRQSHLVLLRELWKEVIEAKGEIIQYSHLLEPTLEDFAQAHKAISKAIDSVRSVYKNEGETEFARGRYPFEPLHDMRRSLDRLYPNKLTSQAKSLERAKMVEAWNSFRFAFLREFHAPAAPFPITCRDATDPRRSST